MTLADIFDLPVLEDEWDLPHIEFVMFEIGSGKIYISSKIDGRMCSVRYLIDGSNICIEYPFSTVTGKLSHFLVSNRSAILEFWQSGSLFTVSEYTEFVRSRFTD
jgi:hypothetical protein